ncbi:hypothetical protein [Mycobacteroides abscessus]|uniref:Uncharacterized protein n=3 Tax=Mycobacteroides abscessus TaxID=36809 RepID=A0AB74FJQ0_9MYCO|nr:hypothetical protein [Mycobacteroides abscessus]EIV84059.1 hypothetical protein MM3A0810R_0820 [Mycobacteroides abscessus 3A-0810-R]EUA78082.1 hypothetical protein I541_2553 [Mycobacteroides abscessus]MBE5400150.1 hypothetical protein [Mycobacteroides abscessus]MBE5409207.1 hypothetical protein [Mycobacteroides abscessus]MBE5414245.1 hypothetical protein [Mycobacteroides abscessus]
MSRVDEIAVQPWPGNPATAWAAVEERARTHRLSDRPEAIPRMDDLGTRLQKMSGLMNQVAGVGLLIVTAISVMMLLRSLSGEPEDWLVVGMAALVAAVMVPLGVFLLLYPRRSWGPTAWVVDSAMLCEAHPYRLRLRKHPSSAAVATILLGGGGIEGETVRMDGEKAMRIVSACEQWATQLEQDPSAYAEFWRRWKREDPEVLPTELLFGPDAKGGFITCVDRHHRWFLAIPRRRKARLGNPWHHAHALPVWWTTEHADSIGIDWDSMRSGS